MRPDGDPAAVGGSELVRTPLLELVRAGLISNRGFIVIGLLIGLISQFGLFDLDERSFEWLEDTAGQVEDWGLIQGEPIEGTGLRKGATARDLLNKPWMVAIGLVLVFVGLVAAVRVLSILFVVMSLYGFTLRRFGEDLRTEYGLFTRVSATVPRHRIQLLSTRRSLLHALFDRAAVQLETAGGGGDDEDSGGASRHWLAPILTPHRAEGLIRTVLPEARLEALEWQPLSPRARSRMLRRGLAVSLLATLPAAWFGPGWWGALLFPLLFGLFGLHAMRYVHFTRWAVTPGAIVFRSGGWTRRMSVVRFAKVQGVSLRQTPFDRRRRMARVAIDTAGAGRVGHRIDIPFLEIPAARRLFGWLEGEAENTDFRW